MEPPAPHDPRQTQALEAVRFAHPDATDLWVATTIDEFFDGALFVVSFRMPPGRVQENYVYLSDGSPLLYQRPDELARYFAGRRAKWSIARLAREFASLGGIAGLIALTITVCICYTFTRTPDVKVPDFLAHTLTSFVSFYMANKFTRKS